MKKTTKKTGAKVANIRKSPQKKRASAKRKSTSKRLGGLVPAQRLVVFAVAFAIIGALFLYMTNAATVIKPLSVEAAAGEGSGLAASKTFGGVHWWMRDGGDATADKPRDAIYAVKFDSSGNPVAVRGSDKFPFFMVNGESNNNWEDIAVDDDGNVWIGDIGANVCSRNNQKLIKVKEPDPTSSKSLEAVATYTFKFPDPASGCNTWNSEAMFWLDGKMYIFAKTSGSPVYRVDLPSGNSGTATLVKLGSLAGGASNISVSSVSSDRSSLVVASHGTMNVFKSSNTGLKGDAFVKDIISRKPAHTATFDAGTKKSKSVEGGSFVNGTRDIAFIAEGKQLYYAKAAAYGNTSGGSGGSTKDTTAPTVSISAPANNATVSGTITIEVNASDNVGIASADVFYDGSNIIRKGTSQGDYGWGSRFDTETIGDGAHTFGVTVYDAAGNQKTAQITLNVQNGKTGDTTAPSVSIISPANNATVSGTITLEVSATDNVGLASVNLLYDGSGIIREGTSQGNYGWGSRFDTELLSNGTHTLSAKATDAAGNTKTATVTVTVKN